MLNLIFSLSHDQNYSQSFLFDALGLAYVVSEEAYTSRRILIEVKLVLITFNYQHHVVI